MENDLKGIENYFELTGGSSYREFELPRFDCTPFILLLLKINTVNLHMNEELSSELLSQQP